MTTTTTTTTKEMSTMDDNEKVYATISAGSVEYGKTEAEVEIDALIEALEEAKEDGATHVLGLSGNWRGAQYVRLGLPTIDWDES